MDLAEIKSKIAALSRRQQDHLAGYLVHLRHRRDISISHEISRLIDNRDPRNWLTLRELKDKWNS